MKIYEYKKAERTHVKHIFTPHSRVVAQSLQIFSHARVKHKSTMCRVRESAPANLCRPITARVGRIPPMSVRAVTAKEIRLEIALNGVKAQRGLYRHKSVLL